MVIYGVALLSACFLAGNFLGDILGALGLYIRWCGSNSWWITVYGFWLFADSYYE